MKLKEVENERMAKLMNIIDMDFPEFKDRRLRFIHGQYFKGSEIPDAFDLWSRNGKHPFVIRNLPKKQVKDTDIMKPNKPLMARGITVLVIDRPKGDKGMDHIGVAYCSDKEKCFNKCKGRIEAISIAIRNLKYVRVQPRV